MGFELGDPIGELSGLEEFVVVLEVIGTNPEDVGDEAPEATEGDGGEGEDRRGIIKRFDAGQAEFVAVTVKGVLDLGDADEEDRGEQEQKRFFEFNAH
jgi:hypothetical protein